MTNPRSAVLVSIPARGGSKRLRRKNIALLGGRPLIAHTIEAAHKSQIADEVFVCTEDEEIARISSDLGAEVLRIPEEMAGDLVSSTQPCLHLAEVLSSRGRHFEALVNLQPSSPLRSSDDIRAAWESFQASGADYLVSVTPIDPHYFHWALVERPDGWQMYFGSQFLKERPLLPPAYRPNGAIKIGKIAALKRNPNFFGKSLAVYQMPEQRSIHVATQFDLICAEAIRSANRR